MRASVAGRVSQKNGNGFFFLFFFLTRLRRVLFWEPGDAQRHVCDNSLERCSAESAFYRRPAHPEVFFFYYPAEVILVCVAHYQRVLGS